MLSVLMYTRYYMYVGRRVYPYQCISSMRTLIGLGQRWWVVVVVVFCLRWNVLPYILYLCVVFYIIVL